MKQENHAAIRGGGPPGFETSHAGIIRIGFEGISQPHLVEHPCFNNLIETPPAPNLQMSRRGRKQGREGLQFRETDRHGTPNRAAGLPAARRGEFFVKKILTVPATGATFELKTD
jgi:hypothetical protein